MMRVIVLLVVSSWTWAGVASADTKLYSMVAGARQYTGSQLTIPVTGPATGSGLVQQETSTAGLVQPVLRVWDAQLDRPATASTDPLWLGGPNQAMQLKTSLAIQVPPRDVIVTFFEGGRSGPPTLSFCPGGTDPASGGTVFNGAAPYNPNCTVVASSGAAGIGIANGIMRYTATANQFGGFGAVAAQGTASLAVMGMQPTQNPATSNSGFGTVAFAGDVIDLSGIGGPIDDPGATGALDGLALKKLLGYTPSGIITQVGATLGAIPNLAQTAWNGNLTTGQVMVWVTAVQPGAPTQMVTLTGSDTRTAMGVGNITMVGGAISKTTLTGHSRTHNSITFTITPEPTMLLGATGALIALVLTHRAMRRRRVSSMI
jgi:hypothetical protein